MEVDRPGPGQELNTGEATTPRQAATAMLLRDGDDGLEVLLVQRNPDSRFMGGAWVFPGGAVQAGDEDHAGAALRELEEEAGIRLASAASLTPVSRWITPAEVRIRFDTVFFVAEAPPDATPRVDGSECVDARWITPQGALDAGARGELMLVFPTIKHLEGLASFESLADAIAAARAQTVEPVQPRVVLREDGARVVLPGEPGYDDR